VKTDRLVTLHRARRGQGMTRTSCHILCGALKRGMSVYTNFGLPKYQKQFSTIMGNWSDISLVASAESPRNRQN